jgi:hypothetical protein
MSFAITGGLDLRVQHGDDAVRDSKATETTGRINLGTLPQINLARERQRPGAAMWRFHFVSILLSWSIQPAAAKHF